VKITAWNIQNGGGNRIAGITESLAAVDADVCVLSEYTRGSSPRLASSLANHGYEYIAHTEPEGFWGGVLIASRTPLQPGSVNSCPSSDRWLHVVVEGSEVEICGAYIPNRERSDTEKAEYWEWLIEMGRGLLDRAVLVCGDFNTGLPNADYDGRALPSAELMQVMLDSGWVDVWRRDHPNDAQHSWWSAAGNGFRIDHAFASPSAARLCQQVHYVTEVNGRCVVHPSRAAHDCGLGPLSDHSMLVVELSTPGH
jgi:exodeoxyribonuclease III